MKKPPKIKKLANKAKIKRRLLKLWSQKSHEIHKNRCAICGLKTGDVVNGKTQKLDAHHIEDKTNYSLRFNIKNTICLCVWHHKFGKDSAHRSPVFFMEWLAKTRPQQLEYIAKHRNDPIDTDDRAVLEALEKSLTEPLNEDLENTLNLKDLDDLESKKSFNPLYNPTLLKPAKEVEKGHLFDDLEEDESSESEESEESD